MEIAGDVKPRVKTEGAHSGLLIILCLFLIYCSGKPVIMNESIRGLLTDSAGNPVKDAVIMVAEGTGSFKEMAAVTDEQGRFFLPPLEVPGTYTVQINRNEKSGRHKIHVTSADSVIHLSW